MTKSKPTARILSASEKAALFNRPKMSAGEKAAREYLGRKQIERNLRIDRYVVATLACLAIAGIAAPFLIMGAM